ILVGDRPARKTLAVVEDCFTQGMGVAAPVVRRAAEDREPLAQRGVTAAGDIQVVIAVAIRIADVVAARFEDEYATMSGEFLGEKQAGNARSDNHIVIPAPVSGGVERD